MGAGGQRAECLTLNCGGGFAATGNKILDHWRVSDRDKISDSITGREEVKKPRCQDFIKVISAYVEIMKNYNRK